MVSMVTNENHVSLFINSRLQNKEFIVHRTTYFGHLESYFAVTITNISRIN